MSIVLYHALISTCSQKVRLALAEKGLHYDSIVLDLPAREHLTDNYLEINPNGVVPALVHDGFAVVDSSVICEYLEETFHEKPLAPKDAKGRATMRAWMRYFEEVSTPAIRVPSFHKLFSASFAAMSEAEFKKMVEQSPLRKHFYRQMGRNGFTEKDVTNSLEKLDHCMTRVENALADGRAYLMGDELTIADLVLVPSVVRMIDIDLEKMWDNRPHVAGWISRVQQRPSFAQAYMPGSRFSNDD